MVPTCGNLPNLVYSLIVKGKIYILKWLSKTAVFHDKFPLSKKLSGLIKVGPVTATDFQGHSKKIIVQCVNLFTTHMGCATGENFSFSNEICLNMGYFCLQRRIGTLCTWRGLFLAGGAYS